MMRLVRRALVCLLLAAGCGPAERAAPGGGTPRSTVVSSGANQQALNPEAQVAVNAALDDAVRRLGVARGQIRVVRVEPRDWPDASLGCPSPGQFAAQVITPGFLVVVEAGGRQLEYHTDTRGRAVVCPGSGAGGQGPGQRPIGSQP
ncbi:MAG: hypothetical protein HY332_06105 [Chloroflexi bacterium]|nr:hypothetical protein [Chloroflexota bacterium]